MHYMFIYETTNNINGKKYVGQHTTSNMNDGYIGSGVILKQAIDKYGIDNFSRKILQYANNKDELNELEKYYIDKFNAIESDMYYNIAEGGYGNPRAGFTDEQMNEYRKKMSEIMNRPEVKAKISEANKGKKLSEEHKAKLSENSDKKRPVIMIDKHTLSPIACFYSVGDASEYFNKPGADGNISNCARGSRKTAYKYIWRYVNIVAL